MKKLIAKTVEGKEFLHSKKTLSSANGTRRR